ncbi:IPT/TIG domain-containing protein [Nonomuraea sp. NPDC001684]
MDSGIWWRVGFMVGVTIGAALLLLYMTVWARPVVLLVPADTPTSSPTTDQGEWMALYGANGAQLTKAQANAKTAAVPVTDPVVRVTENLYVGRRFDGTAYPEAKRELRFPKDALIKKSLLDGMFPDATITAISPASGAAAGGDSVTIRGTDFTPGSTVTFGGTAATSIVVVDERTITCKTPAKAAGAVAVAVATDAGTVTSGASAFTYV